MDTGGGGGGFLEAGIQFIVTVGRGLGEVAEREIRQKGTLSAHHTRPPTSPPPPTHKSFKKVRGCSAISRVEGKIFFSISPTNPPPQSVTPPPSSVSTCGWSFAKTFQDFEGTLDNVCVKSVSGEGWGGCQVLVGGLLPKTSEAFGMCGRKERGRKREKEREEESSKHSKIRRSGARGVTLDKKIVTLDSARLEWDRRYADVC
jgi:hypothetical protein